MLKYQIALLNVCFDNSYKNVLRFNNRDEQIAYFNLDTLFVDAPFVNFNITNLLTTQIVYTPKEHSLNKIMSYNYAIIKDNNDTASTKYYYYFINKIVQNSGNQIILDLELDVMQTYYLDISFKDCVISKAHLNRFKKSGDKVTFDSDINSPLFETENGAELPQLLKKRNELNIKYSIDEADEKQTEVNKWLHDNILAWVYVFIDKNAKYSVNDPYKEETSYIDKANIGSGIVYVNNNYGNIIYNAEYGILCFPIYKNDEKQIYIENNYTSNKFNVFINKDAFKIFREKNADSSYIYAIKLSLLAPFKETFASVDEAGRLKLYGNIIDESDEKNIIVDYGRSKVINLGKNQDAVSMEKPTVGLFTGCINFIQSYETEEIELPFKIEFYKNEIIGAQRDIKFNPKMLSAKYRKLRIVDFAGNYFEYDIQKLGNNKITLLYSEPVQAEITKAYTRIKPIGLYTEGTQSNYTGIVSSNDTGLPLANDKLAEYLANNKNFWLQSSFKIAGNMTKQTILGGLAGGLTSGLAGGLTGAFTGALSGSLSGIMERANERLTLDNLQASPDSLANAKGNALLNVFIQPLSLYYEIWEALPQELQEINDIQFMEGYEYNKIGNIKDFDNIRKYFNYILAYPQTIDCKYPISERVISKIKDIFNNGVRFWNDDTFDYSRENYERFLEE